MNRIQVATAGLFFAWMAHDIEELATMRDTSREPSALGQVGPPTPGCLEESRDGSPSERVVALTDRIEPMPQALPCHH
jgi:hypothetical protein